jgi:hypothetical protein
MSNETPEQHAALRFMPLQSSAALITRTANGFEVTTREYAEFYTALVPTRDYYCADPANASPTWFKASTRHVTITRANVRRSHLCRLEDRDTREIEHSPSTISVQQCHAIAVEKTRT